jgi:hypothetical protein
MVFVGPQHNHLNVHCGIGLWVGVIVITKRKIMSKVKIIRLMSGEEVIGNITETMEGTKIVAYHIKDPAVLIPTPEGKLMFAKWLPYADLKNGITLEERFVVFSVLPQKDLEDHFVSVIVGGLFVPQKKVVDAPLKLSV